MNPRLEPFWQVFLAETGRDPATRYQSAFAFDLTEKSATELLALVLAGQKRATASSLHYFERTGEAVPKPGDLSIITEWDGTPRCVMETTAITILPFRDITFDIARREGEDDSLESWRNNHVKFFTADGQAEGYMFDWDMPVVFEDFEVVYAR